MRPPSHGDLHKAEAELGLSAHEPGTQWQVQLPNVAAVSFRGAVQHDTLMTVLKAAASVR